MLQERVDAIAVGLGKTASVSGGASALVFGLNANEFAAIAGVVVALIGVGVQVFFGRRRDKRETEYHRLRVARLPAGGDEEP